MTFPRIPETGGLVMKRLSLWVACAALLLTGPLVTSAAAQQPPGSPGQPRVVLNADCTITLSWNDAGGPSIVYSVLVTFNGVFQLSMPVGNRLSVQGPLPVEGDWLFVIRAQNQFNQFTDSLPVSHYHTCGGLPPPGGPPTAAPTWIALNVAGSTVTGSFTAVPGATQYEIEGTIQATGQMVIVPLGPNTSFNVPGVPAGNFLVRVRGLNAQGPGPWSAARLVVVGVVLLSGDLQVTLAWNSTADMDLHVIEPSGRHVYYASRTGITAFLDRDNTTGYGPENIYVPVGRGAPGVYQFYIVHFSGALNTSSSIAVTLFPGTSRQVTTLFTRLTPIGNRSLGFNVANVDILNSTITETTGTRAADEREATDEKVPAERASGSQ